MKFKTKRKQIKMLTIARDHFREQYEGSILARIKFEADCISLTDMVQHLRDDNTHLLKVNRVLTAENKSLRNKNTHLAVELHELKEGLSDA